MLTVLFQYRKQEVGTNIAGDFT